MNDLDPILDPDLSFLIEPAEPSAGGAVDARARGMRLHRRRVAGAVATGLGVVLALGALAFAARDARGTASTADHRRTSVPHVDPPLPKGWRHVDWGDLRFAVPGAWSVSTSSPCPQPGVTLQSWPLGLTPSCPAPNAHRMTVVLDTPRGRACLDSGALNGLIVEAPGDCLNARPTATPHDPRAFDPATCSTHGQPRTAGCFLRVLGAQMSFGDVDPTVQAQVLRSITTSPRYRAVRNGPTLDTRRWRTVTGAGVTLKVPPNWNVVPRAVGRTFAQADFAYSCGRAPTPRVAVVGGQRRIRGCGGGPSGRYEPYGNSVWAHRSDPYFNGIISSRPLKHVTINGHRLTTIATGDPADPNPRLTLLVGPKRRPTVVDLSIGGDPDVTRTILTTIRPAR